MADKTLVEKMRELAPRHPRRHELLERAQELEDAINKNVGVKTLLGCWARARTLYCEITGEDLI